MSKRKATGVFAVVVAATIAATLLVQIALAGRNVVSQTRAERIATPPTTFVGSKISQIKVVQGGSDFFTASTSLVNVTGFHTNISVPNHTHAILLLRFSAESVCYGAAAYCEVYALVDGSKYMQPSTGFAFDSNDAGTESDTSWESHAMERSLTVGGGTHSIQLKAEVSAGGASFNLSEMDMTVERIPT